MPVISQGLDYSARRLSGGAIRDAGYDFVLRYLWFPGQRWPALNAAEMADLAANGIEVHGVYEQDTNDPAGGYAGGRRLAAQAVASATAANLPAGSTVFLCADAWLSAHGIPVATAMAFLDGARDIIDNSPYVLGAYGFADFVYAAQDGGHADRFWLCGAESGVRGGIHLYQWNNGYVQVDGLTCDLNKMHLPLTSEGSGGGRAEEGFLMALDDAQQALLLSKVMSMAQGEAGVNAAGAQFLGEANFREAVLAQLAALTGTLSDDEANIIAAVRQQPTGGQVDIPAFVAALVPALVPALPEGVTAEQIGTILVDTLNNVRLTTGG